VESGEVLAPRRRRVYGFLPTMTIQLLAFAQVADQLGFREQSVDCSPEESARNVLMRVAPGLDLSRLRVAIDEEYRGWDEPLGSGAVVALIPPVSGG